MEASDSWSAMIVCTKFKINDLILINFQITCDSIQECLEVLLLDLEGVFVVFGVNNALTHDLIDSGCCQDWLQVGLFVWFEFWLSIKMDTKRWDIHYSVY